MTAHIFGKDNYSLCWGESQIEDLGHAVYGWFYPGIKRFQSVGTDDESTLCRYCFKKKHTHMKPKVKP